MKRYTLITTDDRGGVIEKFSSEKVSNLMPMFAELVSNLESNICDDVFSTYGVMILDHKSMSKTIMSFYHD